MLKSTNHEYLPDILSACGQEPEHLEINRLGRQYQYRVIGENGHPVCSGCRTLFTGIENGQEVPIPTEALLQVENGFCLIDILYRRKPIVLDSESAS